MTRQSIDRGWELQDQDRPCMTFLSKTTMTMTMTDSYPETDSIVCDQKFPSPPVRLHSDRCNLHCGPLSRLGKPSYSWAEVEHANRSFILAFVAETVEVSWRPRFVSTCLGDQEAETFRYLRTRARASIRANIRASVDALCGSCSSGYQRAEFDIA